jgi:two-component system copper resistance phosphate regulon response regulator CusR
MSASDFTTPPRVLVVEDEQKTRESLAEGLRLETWSVATAATGQEALGLLGREVFDLVVLDWMLPDRDGVEVLREMRRRGQPTSVLMLTARSTLNDRVTGLDSGADDYLAKPFAFAELLAGGRRVGVSLALPGPDCDPGDAGARRVEADPSDDLVG